MAKIIQISGRLGILDIIDILPKHKTKHHSYRSTKRIKYLIGHHSGALGKPGIQGAINSTRYVIRAKDWPGMPYTFWAPFYSDDFAEYGMSLLYRCQPDSVVSNHTGGLNWVSVSLCMQGNTSVNGLSPIQRVVIEDFVPWASGHYNIDIRQSFYGHCETNKLSRNASAKKACPGDQFAEYIEHTRKGWGS